MTRLYIFLSALLVVVVTTAAASSAKKKCFSDAADRESPSLRGAWVDAAYDASGMSDVVVNSTSGSNATAWLKAACPLESTVYSCSYNAMMQRPIRFETANCHLRPFDIEKLLAKLGGRSLYFVGDSLSIQQFQALTCRIKGGRVEVEWAASSVVADPTAECPFPNGEHCHLKRACLLLPNQRICLLKAQSNFAKEATGWRDVVVMNLGLHFHTSASYAHAVAERIAAVKQWLRFAPGRRFLWRETSPQHFPTETGEYGSSIKPGGCASGLGERNASAQNWRNTISNAMLREANLNVLRIWPYHLQQGGRHFARRSDCTHWFGSGPVIRHWNTLLYNYLMNYALH